MGDYTRMSGYYDLIMTSGYYDYGAIVDALHPGADVRSVMEIGAGTGLILEQLATRCPLLDLAGIDLTSAMLDIARERLARFPQVSLHLQDVVELRLDRSFDLAFSYGGVWYFVPDGDGFSMISHIRDDAANAEGLQRVTEHVVHGGRLLLGVQSPHTDFARPVRGGLRYSQRITPIADGFRKDYRLDDDTPGATDPLMEQTTDYRTYPWPEAMDLLEKAGLSHREPAAGPGAVTPPLFLEFERR